MRGDDHADDDGLDRQPFVQPRKAKGPVDIVTHIMTKEACPIRDGGGGGPGFACNHHHVSLGARFPSPVCVRLAQAETSTAASAAAEPVNCPEPEES